MAKKKRPKTAPRGTLRGRTTEVKDPGKRPSRRKSTRRKPGSKAKTGGKRSSKKTEIIPMDANAATLIPANKQNSLMAWLSLYMTIEAGDPESNTFQAKSQDLSRCMRYFGSATGSDHPDQWTRSISTGFVKHLLKTRSERTGNRLAPSTVNRVLATVRHTARWIHRQRPFLAGFSMERIQDLQTPEPTWKGLSDLEVTRLRSAAEQLLHLNTRANQNPIRDQAMLLVFLGTALRVSEIIALDLEQYRGKHFRNVKRKGAHVSDRVFLPQEARDALDEYVGQVRGREPGPVFQSKNGHRLAPQNVAYALDRIVAQANAKLSKREQITLTPHVLRHTALRKMAEKRGIRYAQQMAGHASSKYIWRYVQPSADDMESAIDELYD